MHIQRSAIVMHPASEMYGLVRDVPAYPEFLSWCEEARVLEESESEQLASLTIRIAGLPQTFTTRNRLTPGREIQLDLVDGPFKTLHGAWNFKPLGDAGSQIALSLDFDFAGGVLALPFERGFAGVADHLLQDFVRRADDLHAED